MNKIQKIVFLLFSLSLMMIGNKVKAQYDLGIYSLRLVPQTNLSNPAFMPNYKYHFGFPALSSVYAGLGNSGARYNQIFTKTGDSLSLDTKSILKNIKNGNNVNFRIANQWLNAGMRWRKFYFSLSASDIIDVNSFYSKSIVSLAIEGNAAHVGETIDAKPLELKALHYREYALGAAYDFNDKWNFGIKAKLLFGKTGINSEKSNLSLTTTNDYYYLNVKSDVLINTSVPGAKKDSTAVGIGEYMFYGSNFGMGLDLGATFKLNSEWNFSASVLDLGYISYDRWLKSYSSKADFTYKGIGFNQFDGLNEAQSKALLQHIRDSIVDLFQINESVNKFVVPLTAKIYLGASYQLSEKETLGALVRVELFKGILRPSFTASYYRQLNSHFGVTANYSILNRSYFNLGLGFVANFEPLQVYFVTDNLYGIAFADQTRYANFHFGINFIIPNNTTRRTMIKL